MKAKFFLSAALLMCLMAANLGPVVAQSPNQGEATSAAKPLAGLPWSVIAIDSQNTKDRGAYSSMAFDPGTGIPYISYYDATAKTLKLASPLLSGGNCGPNNSWWCRTVEHKLNIGRYSSIAIYRNGIIWSLGIAYVNDNNGGLRFAEWHCLLNTCGWTYWDIIHQNNITVTAPSLKYGSDGVPQISFHVLLLASTDFLYYTKWVGSGGNCTDTAWQCDDIQAGTGVYDSLALTSGNAPAIAYYDGTNKNLMIATMGNSSEGFVKNCGPNPNHTWYCYSIDFFQDVGLFPSMVFKSNVPYIAYYDKTSGWLKLAHWVGQNGGGNCAMSGITTAFEWQCNDLYKIGPGIIINVGISMSLDAGKNPVIAFMDAHDDMAPSALVVARPIQAYPFMIAGNCGNKAGPFNLYQWDCQTLDGGGQYADEAEFSSVAINPAGLAYVAYTEWDNFNNKFSLKLAFQQLWTYLPDMVR